MSPQHSAIVTLLFGAGVLLAVVTRPGSPEPVAGLQPEPAKAEVAALNQRPAEETLPPVRVILPSPYQAR